MSEEIKEILDTPIFMIDNDGFTVYINDKINNYIANLQNKYNKALELLVDYNMPCEFDNFNLLDTDYCEINCSNDEEQFKKCWDKFIGWRIKNE